MPSMWDLVKYRSTIDDGTTVEHLTSELGNPIVVSGVIDAESATAGYSADFILDVLSAEAEEDPTADCLLPPMTADAETASADIP